MHYIAIYICTHFSISLQLFTIFLEKYQEMKADSRLLHSTVALTGLKKLEKLLPFMATTLEPAVWSVGGHRGGVTHFLWHKMSISVLTMCELEHVNIFQRINHMSSLDSQQRKHKWVGKNAERHLFMHILGSHQSVKWGQITRERLLTDGCVTV